MTRQGITFDQIGRLYQLQQTVIEKKGYGCHQELEDLMTQIEADLRPRLKSQRTRPGRRNKEHARQARRYYEAGFGGRLGLITWESYRDSIPPVPEHLLAANERFPILLLVEPRLSLGLTAHLAGIEFGGNDETFQPLSVECADHDQPFWIRTHDGARYQKCLSVKERDAKLRSGEHYATARKGIGLLLQRPELLAKVGLALEFPGSLLTGHRSEIAVIGNTIDIRKLGWQANNGLHNFPVITFIE